MRTLLVTGSGGAGRTAVAAASALRAGRAGARVVLITADADAIPARPAFEAERRQARQGGPGAEPPGARPQPADGTPAPDTVLVDGDAFFRTRMASLQARGAAALDYLGAVPLEDEELTGLAGAQSLAVLHALAAADASGSYDLAVVDLPPAPQALRLLALPEQLRRYLARLLPPQRQAARALRPLLAQLAGVPAPAEQLYDAARRWDETLAAAESAVRAPDVRVRLVVEPGRRAAAELPGLRAALALHGLALESVIANRVLPAGSPDPWLAELAASQHRALKDLGDQAPLYEVPHLGRDPQTPADLRRLADALPPDAAADIRVPGGDPRVDDLLAAEGALVWCLPLPGAEREDLGLVRRGDELIVTVGPYRRALPLPPALRRCVIERAGLHDEELRVRFTPDPALWPRG
ncbi:ArsA-related P-loop ATPase [Streptomyces sp. NPDC051940]|uniref:ArsA family ATPase n=1 Tax=Streptomyces sp. NPDC051940 TaxID=3155675 RepID=UPI0034216788